MAAPLEGALHLQALMPEPDDKLEPIIITDSQVSDDASPDKFEQQDTSYTRMEVDSTSTGERKREDSEMTFESPFLKPAKRTRTSALHNL